MELLYNKSVVYYILYYVLVCIIKIKNPYSPLFCHQNIFCFIKMNVLYLRQISSQI